ncbi:MAG: DUF4917 family protein [Nitrospiraceae bacterium]
MLRILEWSQIADKFSEALILGNGASIALHGGFKYESLLEEAREEFISQEVEDVFDHLDTEDFERVLRMLWHTSKINEALQINEEKTRKAYKSLRTALVKTVTKIHPVHSDVSNQLIRVAEFMKQFKIVLSLNYDLLVYWAMLLENEQQKNRIKDCFNDGEFVSDWQKYLKPYRGSDGSTLVFYPHGNLALTTDINGGETKLTATTFLSLLETVTMSWKSGKYSPLFVSEGTSKQKVSAINRSPYLKTIHDSVLPNLGRRIAIFGWSMGDRDKHILKAICRSNVAEIAVSVVTSEPKLNERCLKIKSKIQEYANGRSIRVVFFDATIQGCWLS